MSLYIDTIIAIVFVFFLFSVIGYIIHEWWATIREKRGKMLEFAIGEILNDKLNKSFNILLYEHPQIDLLRKSQNHLPAYIPSSNFATAVIDLIGKESIEVFYQPNEEGMLEERTFEYSSDSFERFVEGVKRLKHSDLKVLLQSFLLRSTNYLELQQNIENWFNQYMDRVSGWYKTETRRTLSVISIFVVIFFNLDAIYLVQSIYRNEKLRSSLVAAAENMVDNPAEVEAVLGTSIKTQLADLDSSYTRSIRSADSASRLNLHQQWTEQRSAIINSSQQLREKQYSDWVQRVNSFGLPIGWSLNDTINNELKAPTIKGVKDHRSKMRRYFENLQNQEVVPGMPRRSVWTVLLGWLVATVALSFGAPFWFDVLNKIVNIRRTGVKPSADASGSKS